jgi:zinc transport system ATP-binding protein
VKYTQPDPLMPRVLDVRDLVVTLDRRKILDGVSFYVPKGEFLCLCGPNGAGKSTLLKAVLGLIKPTAGTIDIVTGGGNGEPPVLTRRGPLMAPSRAVGYVPQRKTFDRDFPATSIEVIVANLRGAWPVHVRPDERKKAEAALARVGGQKLIDEPIAGLSGGETQRVFLARALVNEPLLIILDEPTAGVDVRGRAEFLDLLGEISASDELAAIMVTHNIAAVAKCAERVLYLDGGVRAWGLPNELMEDAALSALSFHATDHNKEAQPRDED